MSTHPPLPADRWGVFRRHTIIPVAGRIAASIIADARAAETPVVFVTGNSYMPPGRWFTEAEQVWNCRVNDDGEAYEALWEEIGRILTDAKVYLGCPEYDNSLYAVDMSRWEHNEDAADDSDTLDGEWRPVPPANWPEGWLVTRKSDQRHGVVRTAWAQESDGTERVFVEGFDPVLREATGEFLSAGHHGVIGWELASDYTGNPVYAPDIERKAGHRYRGILPTYTSAGSYPLIYVTRGNETLCSDCATAQIDAGNDTNDDPVTDVGTHDDGPDETCAQCGKSIPSAYGDPSEREVSPDET